MRLFHVSEENNLQVFQPRKPLRTDVGSDSLVWVLTERTLPNFLMPRDCPRVTYHVAPHTTEEDKKNHLSSDSMHHVVVLESNWVERMIHTILTIYEFDPKNFILQDEVADYYVSKEIEVPIAIYTVGNLFEELAKRNVEVRIVDNLWKMRDEIIETSFYWSMCRMRNAKPRVKS